MKKKEKIKILLFAVLGLILAVMLISDSKGVSQAVISCIDVCLNSLIPSLFGYMVLCTLLTKSGLGNLIFLPIWYIFRRIIKLDSKMFSVFMMSQIGGYPVGVRLISTLISQNKNYSEIAEKCTLFCYNSGPAFVAGMVGITVYGSLEAGIIIFISCLVSNFLLATVMTRRFKPEMSIKKELPDLSVTTVKDSLISTGHALLTVCLSMVLFNTVLELIRYSGVELANGKVINTVLMSVWEITNITKSGLLLPLPIAATLISFGGLCVVFQILTLSDYKLNALRFIAARAAASLLSGIICYIITMLTGYIPSMQTAGFYAPDLLIHNPPVAVCIAAMTVILLSCIVKLRNNER
ncbi:MAG: hypothetical protein J1E39_00065 [Eubacterium sp.]|nr:hypothetical protein [Eubacterium sp.]